MRNIGKYTEQLVAYQTVKSSLDTYAKRADRQLKPLAEEIYDALQKGQTLPARGSVIADTRFLNKDKARTLTEGIAEFKKRFPSYGTKLQGIIDETRSTKKRYLLFGMKDGRELPEKTYLAVLQDIGIPRYALKSTLGNILVMSEALDEEREEGLAEMLIK